MSIFQETSTKVFNFFSSKLKTIFPVVFAPKKNSSPNYLIFKDHIDSTKTKEEKIKIEKRKRNQAYQALDYFLSLTTYFDFFSADVFQIVKDARIFTQITNKKIVTSDLLLLPFFYSDSKISEILKNYGIEKEKVEEIVADYHIKTPENFVDEKMTLFGNFIKDILSCSPIQLDQIVLNPKIKYSLEINRIFEKAAENAFKRFKTPVISTEIFFITLMEEEDTRVGKIIKKFFTNETDWFLLRYQLIKKLHKQESFIRTEISPNEHYFAYLLKTRFSDAEFENLIETDYLSDAVIAFRNELIADILHVDIYDFLEQEIYASFKAKKKRITRTYSPD